MIRGEIWYRGYQGQDSNPDPGVKTKLLTQQKKGRRTDPLIKLLNS